MLQTVKEMEMRGGSQDEVTYDGEGEVSVLEE